MVLSMMMLLLWMVFVSVLSFFGVGFVVELKKCSLSSLWFGLMVLVVLEMCFMSLGNMVKNVIFIVFFLSGDVVGWLGVCFGDLL